MNKNLGICIAWEEAWTGQEFLKLQNKVLPTHIIFSISTFSIVAILDCFSIPGVVDKVHILKVCSFFIHISQLHNVNVSFNSNNMNI